MEIRKTANKSLWVVLFVSFLLFSSFLGSIIFMSTGSTALGLATAAATITVLLLPFVSQMIMEKETRQFYKRRRR